MKRLLGLDVGDKWIGVAISDELSLIAQPLKTIERISNRIAFDEIYELLIKYNIEKIIVGLPRNMDFSIGPQGEKIIKFANKLKNKFNVEVIFIDERLTTVSAENILIESNVRRENRKKHIDKIAASYILQIYLDKLR